MGGKEKWIWSRAVQIWYARVREHKVIVVLRQFDRSSSYEIYLGKEAERQQQKILQHITLQ